MTETQAKWQETVRGEFEPEMAESVIETISGFLEDDTHEVLREITSELTLSMRALRHFTQKVQYDCHPQIKEMVLFEAGSNANMTVESFTQSLLDQIAEGYELTKVLAFYAMALAEHKT